MTAKRGQFRVGTSGFHYNHWKGIFYPDKLTKSKWFSYYAQHFDTVEINNTFYHLPSAAAFDSWKARATPGFLYALKFNRYGSQMKPGCFLIGSSWTTSFLPYGVNSNQACAS